MGSVFARSSYLPIYNITINSVHRAAAASPHRLFKVSTEQRGRGGNEPTLCFHLKNRVIDDVRSNNQAGAKTYAKLEPFLRFPALKALLNALLLRVIAKRVAEKLPEQIPEKLMTQVDFKAGRVLCIRSYFSHLIVFIGRESVLLCILSHRSHRFSTHPFNAAAGRGHHAVLRRERAGRSASVHHRVSRQEWGSR
jgi:hypothetical protein